MLKGWIDDFCFTSVLSHSSYFGASSRFQNFTLLTQCPNRRYCMEASKNKQREPILELIIEDIERKYFLHGHDKLPEMRSGSWRLKPPGSWPGSISVASENANDAWKLVKWPRTTLLPIIHQLDRIKNGSKLVFQDYLETSVKFSSVFFTTIKLAGLGLLLTWSYFVTGANQQDRDEDVEVILTKSLRNWVLKKHIKLII